MAYNDKNTRAGKNKPGILNIILMAFVGVLVIAVIFAAVWIIRSKSAGKTAGAAGDESTTEEQEEETGEVPSELYTGDEGVHISSVDELFGRDRWDRNGPETANGTGDENGIGDGSGSGENDDTAREDSLNNEPVTGEKNSGENEGGTGSGIVGDGVIGDAKQPSEDERDDDEEAGIAAEIVRERLETMTIHEKVCQLFIIYPSAITGVKNVTEAGNMTENALLKYPVGGFLYNASNIESKEQFSRMLAGVKEFGKIPLILTCDEEGGRVERLMSGIGTTKIGPMYEYRSEGVSKAFDNAFTIASDMYSVGMNMDFAPVADVWSNPKNTVIGDRAYSDSFAEAAELVASAVKGFHEGGVACTLKHFPGHGDTTADTHFDSAVVTKSLDDLRKEEFLPFKAGIEAGADAVMIGHLIVTDISDEPAIFSKLLITDILRGELGFEGVVITDALEMKAISNSFTSADAALMSFKAGADILLCPEDFYGAQSAIEVAVLNGQIEESRLDESVTRILTLKYNMGILDPI